MIFSPTSWPTDIVSSSSPLQKSSDEPFAHSRLQFRTPINLMDSFIRVSFAVCTLRMSFPPNHRGWFLSRDLSVTQEQDSLSRVHTTPISTVQNTKTLNKIIKTHFLSSNHQFTLYKIRDTGLGHNSTSHEQVLGDKTTLLPL